MIPKRILHSAFRHHLFAFALITVVATTLFLPSLIEREVFTSRDHLDYFQPLRWFTAQELKAGRLPLWNPYSASGEPWLANPQTGVFYPPQWLFVALPFATAYMLFLLLHLAILGCSAYLLFARRASQGAALAGAVALMCSGPVLSLLDISNNLATLAWIPLALWCAAEGAWRRGGIVLALAFLGGEPFFAALAALLYAIVRRHRDVIGTALIAFGVSAVQLLPFLEFVRTSDRAGGALEPASILGESMPLRDWPHIAIPPGSVQLSQQFIPVVYMGMLVVALAILGLTMMRKRRDVAGWLALFVFAVVIATGPAFLAELPLTLFRYPARLVPIAAIAVAALAVAGWERLRPQKRWVDLVLVLLIVADLIPRAATLFSTSAFRTDVVPYAKDIGTRGKFLRFGRIDPLRREAWISGYLNLYDRRFDAFTAAPLVSDTYARLVRNLLQSPRFETFAYAGIHFIISRYDVPEKWYPVASVDGVHVFRNPDAYPMAAHLPPGSRSVRRGEWRFDTSHAWVTVHAARDGVLVLRQQVAPGWRVTVDGKPAESLTIDGIFRGVRVPAGAHEIVWTYHPRSLEAGAAITIFTLAAMTLARFVKRSKHTSSMKKFSSGPSNFE